MPHAVRRGEVAALVAASRQAQAAEVAVRQMLGRLGIPAENARPVATLDDYGRPVVRLTLSTDERDQLVDEIAAVLRQNKTLKAR